MVVKCDVFSCLCFFYPYILCSYTVRTHEYVYMFTKLSKIEGFSDSSISGTNNRDIKSLIKISIARRTVRYALSIELHFARNTEFLVFISCGEYDPFSLICISFHCLYDKVIFANFRHFFDTILDDCRASIFCMELKIFHNLSTWSR